LLASCEPILIPSSLLQFWHYEFSEWLRIKHVSKKSSEPQYNRLILVPPVLVFDGQAVIISLFKSRLHSIKKITAQEVR
jgi:hypothetical protein